jgi:ELWxxDGT repeat protein
LWKSDGTEAGTVMVKDIFTEGDATPTALTVCGNYIYFAIESPSSSAGLWRTNGTEAGTVLVDSTSPPRSIQVLNGVLYYGTASELRGIDPVTLAPNTVKDFDWSPRNLITAGGMLYFIPRPDAPESAADVQLWRSDGTAADTLVIETPRVRWPLNNLTLISVNGSLYLRLWDAYSGGSYGDDYYGRELWKVDPSTNTAAIIKDIFPPDIFGANSSSPLNYSFENGLMYFAASDAIHGRELWLTDGTESGTILVADFVPGTGSGNPGIVNVVGERRVVSVTTDEFGEELWRLEGRRILAALTETNSALQLSDKLRAVDQAATGGVNVQIASFSMAGNTGGISQAVLQNMLSLGSGPIVAAPSRVGELTWTFNSGTEAFNYLAEGETLTLDYVLRYTDNAGAFVDQRLVITITGTAEPPHPGDFDTDGDVDGADFVAWQTNFPKPSGATFAQGDADGDGDVDGADFVVWQTNFPFSPSGGAVQGSGSASSAVAPENSTAEARGGVTPAGAGGSKVRTAVVSGSVLVLAGGGTRLESLARGSTPVSVTSAVASELLPAGSPRAKHGGESLPVGEIVPAMALPKTPASKLAVVEADRRFTERDDAPLAASVVDYWFERSPMYRSRSIGRRAVSPIFAEAAEY